MTGNDLFAAALRTIGAIDAGEAPTAAEAETCRLVANRMLGSWTAQRMMIFTLNINEFSLIPGQQTYTLGLNGNFNVARPSKIERMSIVNLNNPAQPLELPLDMLTDAQWQAIPVKLVSSALPQKVYDDGAFPLRNLSFWCVPTVAVKTRIYGWSSLTQFTDLVTDVSFPPGYDDALVYNLAVRLCPEFSKSVTPELAALANESKGIVKSANAPLVELQCDSAIVNTGGGVYNWLTDSTGR